MSDIEHALRETFADHVLSKAEKYAIRDQLEPFRNEHDQLNAVRNRAFELVAEYLREADTVDPAALKWLEQIVKVVDKLRLGEGGSVANEVYFSPGEACKRRILSLLQGAKHSVSVCVFTISDNELSAALLAVHQRGVNLRIITDNDKANDRGSDVDELARSGVPLVKDRTDKHMHHKFALVDDRWVINGSFNWTRSATRYNNENITVTTAPEVVDAFAGKFDQLWQEFGGH